MIGFGFFPSACLSFTQCPPTGAQISMSSKTKDESCDESHLHQCPDVTTSRPPRMRGERIERQWCRARRENSLSKAKAKQNTSVVTTWMGDLYALGFTPNLVIISPESTFVPTLQKVLWLRL